MYKVGLNMKINEKSLCAFAVAQTPIDKEGYLSKRGDLNKHYQRKYFVLKGNLLFYFDKKGDKEPAGLIILEGCSVELVEDDEHFCFKIDFFGENTRNYVFAAESQASMEQWMKALARSGYDYMKLMVGELRKQLDDMEDIPKLMAEAAEFEKSLSLSSPTPPPRRASPVPPPRHSAHNSPVPPPRHRTPNQSFRQQGGGNRHAICLDDIHSDRTSKISITFKELHNSYGRPILSDIDNWKQDHKMLCEQQETVDNLISLIARP